MKNFTNNNTIKAAIFMFAATLANTTFAQNNLLAPTGNVGIGTTTPAAQLHVKGGNLTLEGNAGAGIFSLSSAGTNNYKFIPYASAALNGLGLYNATKNKYNLWVDSSGKIGMATMSPRELLEVNGNLRVNFNSSVYGNSSVYSNSTVYGNSFVNGSLGINTTTPTQKLHISNGNILLEGTVSNAPSTIQFKSANVNTYILQPFYDATNPGNIVDGFGVLDLTGSRWPLFISDNGRVGVGNNITPRNLLDLGTTLGSTTSDVLGKKLAIFNNGNNFFGLGISSGKLQFHAASTDSEEPGMVLTDAGRLGIGNVSPQEMLDVDKGNLKVHGTALGHGKVIMGVDGGVTDTYEWYPYNKFLGLYNRSKSKWLLAIDSTGKLGLGTTNPRSLLDLSTSGGSTITDEKGKKLALFNDGNRFYGLGFSQGTLQFHASSLLNGAPAMVLTSAGNVGIGTTSPQSALAVNGTITSKVMITTQTGWADFVFKNDYNLPSLTDVENYIKVNGHLPAVPSETEILTNGNNLGQTDAILLQKIEELTLYMIELKKENQKLSNDLQALTKKVSK